jgi:pimeloyl-ACP methyl ester carboxylesterase
MKRAYTDIPEGQIHYRTEGKGEPILLLHAGVTSSDEYTGVIPFLSKKYCAIAMDFLGNGDSDKPPYAYQILDHTRTVVSFMDSLGIKQATVVGQHFGGKVGVELAAAWPERVKNLVVSSIGYPEAEEVKTDADTLNFTNQVEIKPDGSHLMEWWRRSSMWGNPLNIVEDRFLEYVKAGPRGEEIHWAGSTDPRPKLPLIHCPTLVLSATGDPMCAVTKKIHKLIPNSKFVIIYGGIDIDRVCPKEFAEAILNFLQKRGADSK